jgi:hypothetical protein
MLTYIVDFYFMSEPILACGWWASWTLCGLIWHEMLKDSKRLLYHIWILIPIYLSSNYDNSYKMLEN